MHRAITLLTIAAQLVLAAAADYLSARRKLDSIENHTARPGSRITLTPAEINAYARHEIDEAAPGAMRNALVTLGANSATGSALVNFLKLRQAQGSTPGWFLSKLLDGERDVEVTARFQSGGGTARVSLERVSISGVTIDGEVLQFLIDRYVRPRYPEAKIDQPFELGDQVERFEVQPSGVSVYIGLRKAALSGQRGTRR